MFVVTFALVLLLLPVANAEAPKSLVTQNVPDVSEELLRDIEPYLEYRTATLQGWHPTRRALLISTRFANTNQLHLVEAPMGARKQLTFFEDRVAGGHFLPDHDDTVLFVKDIGGGEFFQIFRLDRASGKVTMLTDGKSRNSGGTATESGKLIAYSSTRVNGTDGDIFLMNPLDHSTDRMLFDVPGPGWGATDFSPDEKKLALIHYISANESELFLGDIESGKLTQISPKSKEKVSYSGAHFSADGKSLYFTSDAGSEFHRLTRMELSNGKTEVISKEPKWDVDSFEITNDGKHIAYITNEAGVGVLHVIETATGKKLALPAIPAGTVSGLEWHDNGRELGFSLDSSRSAQDVFSISLDDGKLTRWTESETGGLPVERNALPELVTMKSFDGQEISAFVYRPDAKRFPGPRPSIISIHGGPESQYRPSFLGRTNYYVNELGVAIVSPNVRGSSGYGKSYLGSDNGYKREDSVRDIGTVISWIEKDPMLDGKRIGVMGGSYGGYMTLAVATHYPEKIRAAVDVVGISNFVTFLKNTQDYRRDLRRVEYGDERDAKMNEFLQKISPLNNASKIRSPLYVIQGYNDPRVPFTEAEQIVKALKENEVPVWYLVGMDEGHGFRKKANVDYQFATTILFWKTYLLE